MPITPIIIFLNSHLWQIFAVLLFTLIQINPHPLGFKHDATFSEMILVFSRRLILVGILFLMILLPAGLGLLYSIHNDITIFIHWYVGLAAHYWRLALAAVLAGFLVKIFIVRYILPYLSNLKRSYRVELTQDKLSDIRYEKEKYTKKIFNPVDYYKADHIFLGLDGSEEPVYVSIDDWLETNMQIIGPTRFGKGILMGVQIDQAIRNGYCVMYIDPKGDKNIPRIMENRATELGRKFIYDLNDQGQGGWHPFMGGNERAKRARILMAFGLENTGNESDFYKINERQVLDEIMPRTTKVRGLNSGTARLR